MPRPLAVVKAIKRARERRAALETAEQTKAKSAPKKKRVRSKVAVS